MPLLRGKNFRAKGFGEGKLAQKEESDKLGKKRKEKLGWGKSAGHSEIRALSSSSDK